MINGSVRRRLSVALACGVLVASPVTVRVLSAGATTAPVTVDGNISDWTGQSSGIGGSTQLSGGEFIYQDHIWDDLGADTGAHSQQYGQVENPKGDFRYPTDENRYGNNAADIFQVRFATDHDTLYALIRLNTYKATDSTVVGIGFDTDGNPATGGESWPYDAGFSAAGVDDVVTLWGNGGSITDLSTGQAAALSQVAASTDDNAIEAAIPLAALGDRSTYRVWVASGLWDPTAHTWMQVPVGNPSATAPGGGMPTVTSRAWNVAFRPDETGSYMEEQQAAALAAGDITPFAATLDLNALRSHASVPFRLQPRHFYDVIIDTGFTVAPYTEGTSYAGVPGRFQGVGGSVLAQKFQFYGRYQPYGLYVPSTYDGQTPLPAALVLHGIGGSYSTYNDQPGFLRDMGEGDGTPDEPPMFLITPLARGGSFYADYGEADTLAVLRDAFARLPIDHSRLYLTGYSMGGYGVYRFASLYPDLFAAAVVWAGYTGEFTGSYLTDGELVTGQPSGGNTLPVKGPLGGSNGRADIGDTVDTLANLRWLPLLHMFGTNDEIVPNTGQYAAPRRLAQLGYRSRVDIYPGYEHFSFALVDDWKQARSWLGDQRRMVTPRTVDYDFSDGWTAPGLAEALGLHHGDAWWTHDLTMRDHSDDGLTVARAELTSLGVPGRSVTPVSTTNLGAAPTPHTEQAVSWQLGDALPTGNTLQARLRDVGGVRITLADADLHLCGLTIDLDSDGPVSIVLDGQQTGSQTLSSADASFTSLNPTQALLSVPAAFTGRLTISCS
ncbi:MAG TPA: prolyl oligopeptidase family serine peptidase [Mycobacteriales bacterium]|nr:prolyl oligopeptidase family serine peptidase [Mycobacteriales bacterium]